VLADWDLFARVAGLERLDVVVTDRMLAGPLHERLHRLLPGIEEVRFESEVRPRRPSLAVPSTGALVYQARDREEEVAGFARRVKQRAREAGAASLDRIALVVRQPLPYAYLTREVLQSAGIPCQLFDALPLAAEPYAAAVDTVFSCVSSNFARGPAIAVLGSPHFRFESAAGEPLTPREVSTLDRALSEGGYLGDTDALERLVASWASAPAAGRVTRALQAGRILLDAVRGLQPLCSPAPVSAHLETLLAFLTRHDRLPGAGDPARSRHLRARGAIRATLAALRDAYSRFDAAPSGFDEVAALVRRWIESQTFTPRTGDAGIHVVDTASAPFGRFEHAQLAGLVEGEWPDRPRRNIFYSASILRDLGWPGEADRRDGARAEFGDLLTLPSVTLAASTFLLEAEAIVSPSPFVDEVEHAGLDGLVEPDSKVRIFDYEALGYEPVDTEALSESRRVWAAFRARARERESSVAAGRDPFRGTTCAPEPAAYSLSALERYQDCPFKFFAADLLRLEEAPEDEDGLSPRARGRFIHEVFQRFFEAWDAQSRSGITPERFDEARDVFAAAAEPLLARLPQSDATLERTRLFGSAISVGIVDTVLALEAARPSEVRERWLEYRFDGEFSLGDASGRRVALKGVADRIDLLAGNALRVFDYKTGSAPNPKRALQVPVYALCAQEVLAARDGVPWRVDDAAYIALSGKRSLVAVTRDAKESAEVLAAARARVLDIVDGIGRGEFPPRPHDPMICRYCAYAPVCRKDYVGD
jgi:RecB family exonuclease